jgi:preprotein translocase subunit SecG
MVTIVVAIHVMICLALIIVILLQQGKGAEIGAVFGGSSQTVFGASGAGNVMTKATWAMAAVFFATSIFLAYASTRRFTGSIFGSGGGINHKVVFPAKPAIPSAPEGSAPLEKAPVERAPVGQAPVEKSPMTAPAAPANHAKPLAPRSGP